MKRKKRFERKTIRKAFTLIELTVVVIIIGILAAIALPRYTRSREKTMDKQAQVILSLIRAAERNYYMEFGNYYYGATSPDQINSNLNLDLVNDGNWINYCITGSQGFYARIERNKGGFNRYWWINATNVNATCDPPNQCP